MKEHTINNLNKMSLEEIEKHHDEIWDYLKKVSAVRDYKRVIE